MTVARPLESEPLPASSFAEELDTWPEGNLYGMHCFQEAKALGSPALRALAESYAVSTPGTLGERGSWRIAGHRVSIIDLLALAEPPVAGQHSEDGHGVDDMAERAEEWFGWNPNGETRDKIFAALAFALLFPDLLLVQVKERGGEPWLSGLPAEVAEHRARAEKKQLRQAVSLPWHEGDSDAKRL